jgi:gamma-glutamylcyclotransferase (GGCT)/AIG2-like uncharacterized protein YtfP
MTQRLFVYGTLQIPTVQQVVFGRSIMGLPDTLPGFRKSEINLEGHIYPIAVRDADSQIDGLLLELTSDELARGDEYETSAYDRVRVRLKSGIEAWVYCLP